MSQPASLSLTYACRLAAVLSLATHTFAQTVASSVYVYNGGFTGSNFTFAINLAQDSQDLFFHLSGPTKFSWLAVGTGNEMTNSLMFVAYANSGGNSAFIIFTLLFYSTDDVLRCYFEPENMPVSKARQSGYNPCLHFS